MKQRLVVIGNGMAGMRSVEELLLMIATDSKAYIPAIPGYDLEDVIGFRDIFDVNSRPL